MTKAALLIKRQTRFLADGDSLTVNPGAAGVTAWPSVYATTATKSLSLINISESGDKIIEDIIPRATRISIDTYRNTKWTNVYAVWAGTNDLQFAVTQGDPSGYMTGTVAPQYAALLDARRAAGWKVAVFTLSDLSGVPSGASCNALRGPFNTVLRSWLGIHCDAVVDLGADPNLGPSGVAAGSPYFDQSSPPHMTQLGQNQVAALVAASCNSLL